MAHTNSIARLREARGWSRPKLAAAMGTSPQQVERLEKGHRRLTQEWIEKAAAAFGVPPAQIIDDSPPALPTNVRQIPRLGRVPASALREALAEASGSVTVPIRVPKEAFSLEIEGDSMDLIAPAGSDAIVDPNDRKLFAGDLYVIATEDGEATFKRYLDGPARLVPVSSNPAHKEILIGAEPIRVIGRVTDVLIGAGLLRQMG